MGLNTRSMLGRSLFLVLCLQCGTFAVENEYLDFINDSIDEYMTCINGGGQFFETGRRFESFVDPVAEKLYEFHYTDKKRVVSARKQGKDTEIRNGVHYPDLRNENRNNAEVLLRYIEKVQKVRSSVTEESATHGGHGSVEVGVNLWIVEVSVKTTVEGEQTDKTIRESENTTTQIWDRIQVVPAFTNSNNVVKRFQKNMKVTTEVERHVKGYLPIMVKRQGKDLASPGVWQKCGSLAPIKLSDNMYIVSYENFANDEWEESDDGGLIQQYPEEGKPYKVDLIKFKRRLEAQPHSTRSIKKFCKLLDPKRKIKPVIPDLDEDEGGIVEEDKEGDDEESPDPTKEHNIDLNEFAENLGGNKPEDNRCKKKNKAKCGKKAGKGNKQPKGKKGKKNKNKRNRQG